MTSNDAIVPGTRITPNKTFPCGVFVLLRCVSNIKWTRGDLLRFGLLQKLAFIIIQDGVAKEQHIFTPSCHVCQMPDPSGNWIWIPCALKSNPCIKAARKTTRSPSRTRQNSKSEREGAWARERRGVLQRKRKGVYFCIMSWTNSLSETRISKGLGRTTAIGKPTVNPPVTVLVSLANHLVNLIVGQLLAD